MGLDARFVGSIFKRFSPIILRSEPKKSFMQTSIIKIRNQVALLFCGALLGTLHAAWAESDMQLQEKALKAREMSRHADMDHAAQANSEDETGGFHGVFYGYLPCKEKDCDGLKMTLSLKQKNNYLLVSQYARASSIITIASDSQ